MSYRAHVLFDDGVYRVPVARYKFVLVGSSNVGKTQFAIALTKRVDEMQSPAQLATANPTVAIDFQVINVRIGADCGVGLIVWDTAGQERFQAIAPNYIRDAHAIFVFFDLTSRQSFRDVTERWIPLVDRQRNGADDDPFVILIGNKCDLIKERVVSEQEAQTFAHENAMYYTESSSVKVERCQTIVKFAAQRVHTIFSSRRERDTGSVNVNQSVVVHGKCCSR